MKIKRTLSLFIVISLCLAMFAGCGNGGNGEEDTPEYDDGCYVTFEDGEEITELGVEEYGDEFTFPEPMDQSAPGEFLGWLGMYGIYQPGETGVSEEFMGFTALRSDPDAGTLLALDSPGMGYAIMTSQEEMPVYSPYENWTYGDRDDYFDHWTDEDGNTYEGGEYVKVENGEVLILTAVYGTDLSSAYRVDVYYNTGVEDFDDEYHGYVKPGYSIPLAVLMEPAGLVFDGWYDAPEGGELLCGDSEMFEPASDISIYGHWTEE